MTRSWAMADQPDRIVTLSVNNTSQRSNTMSSPDSSSPIAASSPLESDERTCHILPCNIDFQGMAPTHVSVNIHLWNLQGKILLIDLVDYRYRSIFVQSDHRKGITAARSVVVG
jgi:hypothetical protein